MPKLIAELDRRIEYYTNLAEQRKTEDPEISLFYRGAASSLNLLASWLQRANDN